LRSNIISTYTSIANFISTLSETSSHGCQSGRIAE
jgi:hypothetical protein